MNRQFKERQMFAIRHKRSGNTYMTYEHWVAGFSEIEALKTFLERYSEDKDYGLTSIESVKHFMPEKQFLEEGETYGWD